MLSLSGELSVEIVVNDILLQTNAKTLRKVATLLYNVLEFGEAESAVII